MAIAIAEMIQVAMSSGLPGRAEHEAWRTISPVGWLIAGLAIVAVLVLLALGPAARGREGRREAAEGREREVSPREQLARAGGMASFGLNLPWWTRTDR
jgi:hypothetical protein